MDANIFQDSVEEAETLLTNTIEVSKGKSPTEAGKDMKYMGIFGEISECVDCEQRYRLTCYPFMEGDEAPPFLWLVPWWCGYGARYDVSGHCRLETMPEFAMSE